MVRLAGWYVFVFSFWNDFEGITLLEHEGVLGDWETWADLDVANVHIAYRYEYFNREPPIALAG